jgi:hypothetical protein
VTSEPVSTVMDLCVAERVATARIYRDLRRGRIVADKPGRDYLFSPAQFQSARDYYRALKREGRKRARRTNAGP